MAPRHPLVALGYMLLGSGLVVEGWRAWRGGRMPQPFGLADAPRGRGPGQLRVLTRADEHRVGNIEQRVALIQAEVEIGSKSLLAKEMVARILGRTCGDEWCIPPKDYLREVAAFFDGVKDPRSPIGLRYTRDHARIDQFMRFEKLLQLKIGDCDDFVIVLASVLVAAGYPCKARVIQAAGEASWSHIYVVVGLPPTRPTRWVALDPTVRSFTIGQEANGAAEALATGRPAGDVLRTKDFNL